MEPLSYEIVSNTFMTIVGFLGIVSLVASLVITFRTLKKPFDERNETIREHSEKLDRDWQTLQDLRDEMGILLNGQMLLLQHELTNNHKDKLQEHQDFIQRYLIEHHTNRAGESHG